MKLASCVWTIPMMLFAGTVAVESIASPAVAQTPTAIVSTAQASTLQPGVNRVSFESEGVTLVGNLYLPESYQRGDRLPGVIVTGSWTTVKEQMAGTYAEELAKRGYAALAFDFRNFGESGGTARNYESPTNKIADIRNAVSFLQTIDAIDPNQIAGLGICASAGYMAVAAAEDSRIQSFVAIAPWIHDPALVNMIYGGEEAVQQRIAIAQAARAEFERTGQVASVPAISTTDSNAAMFGEFDYYLNPERGAIPEWGNQFAVMSWSEWLTFSAMPNATQITVPTLFIHSETAAIPDGARQFFAAIPTAEKNFAWLPDRSQFDFYDQQQTIDEAIALAVEHLQSVF